MLIECANNRVTDTQRFTVGNKTDTHKQAARQTTETNQSDVMTQRNTTTVTY